MKRRIKTKEKKNHADAIRNVIKIITNHLCFDLSTFPYDCETLKEDQVNNLQP